MLTSILKWSTLLNIFVAKPDNIVFHVTSFTFHKFNETSPPILICFKILLFAAILAEYMQKY